MAHRAAGAGLGLAIKVDRQIAFAGECGDLVDIIANQIDHFHIGMARAIAQRPTGYRADMLFKLIDRAAILGPMARIMHTRRDFVHDQPAVGHE